METIKSKQEFERVFTNGKRASHPLVRITFVKEDQNAPTRIAFVAAKRLGNAVFRNRCKFSERPPAGVIFLGTVFL